MNIEALSFILDPIINAGPLHLIFLVFIIIGVIIRLKPLSAIRNGLMIAMGFQGVYIVVDYFLNSIGLVYTALAERYGAVFTYTDIGWAAFASFSWGWPWAYVLVAIFIFVNIFMIFTKMTDTVNLNIWDFWEPIFACLIVMAYTKNIPLMLIVGAAFAWFNLILSDFSAQKGYPEVLGFENVSFYQGGSVIWIVFGHYLSMIFEKFNWKEIKITPEYIQEKYSVLGEPVVLGGLLALLMGIGAGFFWIDVILLMIRMTTSLVLLPVLTGIIMQALVPVSDAAVRFLKKTTKGKNLYIGIDPAIALGNTTTIAVGILMIPIMLAFAFVIPGVLMVPLADLSLSMFAWIFLIAPMKFDFLRSFIAAAIAGVIITLMGILIAPFSNAAAVYAGAEIPAGMAVSSTVNSYTPENLVAGLLGNAYSTLGFIGVVSIIFVSVVISVIFRLRYLRNMSQKR